jgi:hypothetical protein
MNLRNMTIFLSSYISKKGTRQIRLDLSFNAVLFSHLVYLGAPAMN